jgi:N-formylglutamate deformylase
LSVCFDFREGSSPLLISVPHDGREIPPHIAERMTDKARAVPDTDWHVRRLYEFAASLDATVIEANYSRYVVDLNRPPDDERLYPGQLSTGLCPAATFAGDAIYIGGGEVSDEARAERVRRYWRPYHERLERALGELRERHGYALLWDAHSIPGEVPLLFDGTLPDLNIGTNGGASAFPRAETAVMAAAQASQYSSVLNGRFRGGYITRHYGAPGAGVSAIQLELAQRCYMDEESLRYDETSAERLGATIRSMLEAYLGSAASR